MLMVKTIVKTDEKVNWRCLYKKLIKILNKHTDELEEK